MHMRRCQIISSSFIYIMHYAEGIQHSQQQREVIQQQRDVLGTLLCFLQWTRHENPGAKRFRIQKLQVFCFSKTYRIRTT